MPDALPLTTVDLGRGVGAAFTTRIGGVSAPPYGELNLGHHVGDEWDRSSVNRELLATAVGVDPRRCCYLHQVHGDRVHTVLEQHVGTVRTRGGRRDGDAMVTRVRAAPLVVLVADGVPVLLADPSAGVVAAVHAGRRGLLAGVVGRTVEVMRAEGATDVRAAVGPSVCGHCYEVPAAMAAEVDLAVPGTAGHTRVGTPSLDLAQGVAAQLAAVGVTRVSRDRRCTREDRQLYSHRRDGVTGRFAGLVWLEP